MSTNLTSWITHYNLLIFDEIDSTNEEAKRLVKSGVEGDFIIWAKSQSKGKGRYGRKWGSPEGNFYLSLLLRPEFDIIKSSQISFVIAVAIGEVLYRFSADKKIEYKWPNDILIDGKKLAGILLESSVKANSTYLDWLIIGAGINVVSSPKKLPYPTTSMAEEAINLPLNELVDEFMKSFSLWYSKWQSEGFELIREKWLAHGKGIGEVITVSVGQDRISGVFEDITQEGCIKLVLSGGQVCFVSAGEVFYDINEYNNCNKLIM